MSTRGIVCVQKDYKYKFAMTNHYDSYPEELGVLVLNFIKDNRTKLEEHLNLIEMIDREQILNKCYASIGSKTQYDNLKYFDKNKVYEIVVTAMDLQFDDPITLLENVANGIKTKIENGLRFAAESLMCEYGYVINLDDNKLEIYVGFNTIPLDSNERFADIEVKNEKYYQIKKICEFDINDLPSENYFLDIISKSDKEYDNKKEEYEAKLTNGYILEKYVDGQLIEKINKKTNSDVKDYIKIEGIKALERENSKTIIKYKEKILMEVNTQCH